MPRKQHDDTPVSTVDIHHPSSLTRPTGEKNLRGPLLIQNNEKNDCPANKFVEIDLPVDDSSMSDISMDISATSSKSLDKHFRRLLSIRNEKSNDLDETRRREYSSKELEYLSGNESTVSDLSIDFLIRNDRTSADLSQPRVKSKSVLSQRILSLLEISSEESANNVMNEEEEEEEEEENTEYETPTLCSLTVSSVDESVYTSSPRDLQENNDTKQEETGLFDRIRKSDTSSYSHTSEHSSQQSPNKDIMSHEDSFAIQIETSQTACSIDPGEKMSLNSLQKDQTTHASTLSTLVFPPADVESSNVDHTVILNENDNHCEAYIKQRLKRSILIFLLLVAVAVGFATGVSIYLSRNTIENDSTNNSTENAQGTPINKDENNDNNNNVISAPQISPFVPTPKLITPTAPALVPTTPTTIPAEVTPRPIESTSAQPVATTQWPTTFAPMPSHTRTPQPTKPALVPTTQPTTLPSPTENSQTPTTSAPMLATLSTPLPTGFIPGLAKLTQKPTELAQKTHKPSTTASSTTAIPTIASLKNQNTAQNDLIPITVNILLDEYPGN